MAKELKAMNENYGKGGRHRGRALVTSGGAVVKELGALSPVDAQTAEQLELYIRLIASVFRVPPFLVGGTGDTKYNNVGSRLSALYRDALAPLIRSIRQRFKLYFRTEIKADLKQLVQGDIGTAIDLAGRAVSGGVMTPNESREYFLDLDPIDDPNADRIGPASSSPPPAPDDEDLESRIIPFRTQRRN